jgi:hypothetical protein
MLGYFAGVKWPPQLNLDQLHNQRGGCVKAQPGSAYANVLAEAESMAQSSRSECLFKVASFSNGVRDTNDRTWPIAAERGRQFYCGST